MQFDVVVPTIGRRSLGVLLQSLARAQGPLPQRIVLVDDRRVASPPLVCSEAPARIRPLVRIVRGKAAGPASARNAGWRACTSEWIAFLDDDVVVDADWFARLARDLENLSESEGGSQGRVRVPLPDHRAPTDWERNVAGLESSAWITADMAYRREILVRFGGFNERFKRAYREDSDFALRVTDAGVAIAKGTRGVLHPVRSAGPWISLRLQAGNADDAIMRALHGVRWRERARTGRGRFAMHALTVALAAAAPIALAAGARRTASLFGAAWLGATAEFAWRRIAPGPRTAKEISAMIATSAAIPFAAVYHRARGTIAARDISRSMAS